MTVNRHRADRTQPLARLRLPLTAGLAALAGLTGGVDSAAAALPSAPAGFTVRVFASAPATTPATIKPDDIARLGDHVFVGWQNGVGTVGEPNPLTGQTSSTVVEYAPDGSVVQSLAIPGKVDGLGGDPLHRRILATVNEDGNSSLYAISPRPVGPAAVVHYVYSPAPDAGATGGVLTGGGTDAVSVYGGRILLSASNPGTPNATAVFAVRLRDAGGSHVARLTPTFSDSAPATDASTGQTVQLGLTDPDSNAVVPFSSPRFGGQFVLVGQADQELVFARGHGLPVPFPVGLFPASLTDRLPGVLEGIVNRGAVGSGGLTRLALTRAGAPAGIDDVRWIGDSGSGTLYAISAKDNTVYAITGPFAAGDAFGSADTPTNTELDRVDLATGQLTPFVTGLPTPKGLLWVP